MSRVRAWIFTINNYTDDDMADIEKLKNKKPGYLIVGKEVSSTGTPHLQGYVRFTHPRRLKEMAIVLRRARLEAAKGSDLHNKVYCSKERDLLCELGEPSKKQGKRTDIEVAREVIKDSPAAPMRTLLEETNCNYQCVRLAEKYLTYLEVQRSWAPLGIWLWGKSGAGKSTLARKLYPNAYHTNLNGKWWDGYDAHEEVIINDFRRDYIKFRDLLVIMDPDPLRVEYKGGHRQLLAKGIIITCPKHPRDLYTGKSDEDLYQLTRRFPIIVEIK